MNTIYQFRNAVAAAMFSLGLNYSRNDIDAAADMVFESGLNGG